MTRPKHPVAPALPPDPAALPALAGLLLGALGLGLLARSPLVGVFAFAAGGAALRWSAGSRPLNRLDTPLAPEPLKPWELWVALLLLLGAAAARFWRLDLYPPGAIFPEIIAAGRAAEVEHSYTPHVVDFHAGWPTLIFYQARLFMRFFGWGVVAHRLSSAIYGTLAVLAFFLAARRLFAPGVAAVVAALFSVSNMAVFYSRLFYPIIVLYLAVVAAIYFFTAALQTRRNLYWAGAGAGIGLALNGYYSGRLVPLLFAAWAGWLWFTRPELRPRGKAPWLWFLGGLLLLGGPVLCYAVFKPGDYWNHVADENSNSGQGLGAYWRTFTDNLPAYARMFHLQPDGMDPVDDGLPMIPLLKPDPLTQALFPLGLFLCLTALWRPLPALLLAGLAGFVLPAIMGGRFPHPTTRRAALVLPFVYLMAAQALDVAWASARRWADWARGLGLGLLVAALGLVCVRSTQSYFVDIMSSAHMRWAYNNGGRLAGELIKAHPDAQVRLGYHLQEYPEVGLLFPQGRDLPPERDIEDALSLDSGREALILLDPYQRGLLPLLRRLYPGLTPKIVDEPGTHTYNTRQDPFYPTDYFIQLELSRQQLAQAPGLLDDQGRRVDAAAPDFGQSQAGRHLSLQGVLLLPKAPALHLDVAVGWPHWRVKVNGAPASAKGGWDPLGRSATLELEGTVPARAQGPLPLSLQNGSIPLGALLPLPARQGLSVSLRPGEGHFDGPAARSGRDPFMFRRITDPDGLPAMPYSALYSGKLSVPTTGLWQLRLRRAWNRPSILVGGQTVYQSLGPDAEPKIQALSLKAGVAEPFQLRFPVFVTDHPVERTIVLEAKGPGDADWAPLPLEWLQP